MIGQHRPGLMRVKEKEALSLHSNKVMRGGWPPTIHQSMRVSEIPRQVNLPCYADRLTQLKCSLERFPVDGVDPVNAQPDSNQYQNWLKYVPAPFR